MTLMKALSGLTAVLLMPFLLYSIGLQLAQGSLPLNLQQLPGVTLDLAFNTAVSSQSRLVALLCTADIFKL